ncbi:MAG: hypothetical protein IPG32_16705, partial [Saprospirales bacterium]|nr:hypothetical protein [Saprospirales bacterium]
GFRRPHHLWEQGSGGTVGNNPFDNLSLDAFPLGADIFLHLSFQPANNSVDLSVGYNLH